MKKLITLLLVLIFSAMIPCTLVADFQKTKIAVLDFELHGKGYETHDMGKIVAEWLITALVKGGRFDVIERRLLSKIVKELDLSMSGLVDQRNAVKVGKLLGVKVVISGAVMKLQNTLEVNARIIDVESGTIITAESIRGTTALKLEDLVVQMADKIIRDFPLEGYVVNVSNKTVSIDLGERAGVRIGMRFVVFKEGEIIKHPKTGEVLDVERIETGIIRIKSTRQNMAEGKIIGEETPGSIEYGQMVKSVVKTSPPIGRYQQPVGHEKPTKLPQKPLSDLKSRLSKVDLLIIEGKRLKKIGSKQWKVKIKQAFVMLKPLLAQHPTSAEVYFYYAKAYYVAGRLWKGDRCLRKVIYYDPGNAEAFALKGNAYYHYGKNRGHEGNVDYDYTARRAYEAAGNISKDKNFQAMMYFKIGNVYNDLAGNKKKAIEYWQRAISTAPNSKAAQFARNELAG